MRLESSNDFESSEAKSSNERSIENPSRSGRVVVMVMSQILEAFPSRVRQSWQGEPAYGWSGGFSPGL